MTPETEYDGAPFRVLVAEYELLMLSTPSLSREAFELAALGTLARLLAAGAAMTVLSDDEVDESADVDDSLEPLADGDSEAEPGEAALARWKEQRDALADFLGDHNHYFYAYNPLESEIIRGELADDLVDILIDLQDGASAYDEEPALDATWMWSCTFWHWGHHAVAALQALHRHVTWGDDGPQEPGVVDGT